MTASRTKSLEPKLTLLVREQHTKTFHISVHCWTHPTITGLTRYKVFVFSFFFLTICLQEISLLFTSFHSSMTNSSMAKCHCTLETARCPRQNCSNGTLTKPIENLGTLALPNCG